MVSRKLLLLLMTIITLLSCSTDIKKTTQENKKVHLVRELLENLDKSFHSHDKMGINDCWLKVIKNDSDVINYLIDSVGDDLKDFYWYDTVKRTYQPRAYTKVNSSLARLHLICAIYYKDLFFAFERKIYDNEKVSNFREKTEVEKFNIIKEARMNISMDSIWNSVLIWRQSDRKERPFYKTSYFWFGEKNGNLSFENSNGYYFP